MSSNNIKTHLGKTTKLEVKELLVSEKEKKYRQQNNDRSLEDLDNIKCTKCAKDFSENLKNGCQVPLHPVLGVIFCNPCSTFYCDGEFSMDENEDKYCRWCGEGGMLFICSSCPHGFCPKCIRKNLGSDVLKSIKKSDDWNCFLCNSKPLWELRLIAQLVSDHCRKVLRKKEEAKTSRLIRIMNKSDRGSFKIPVINLSEEELKYRKDNELTWTTEIQDTVKCTKCSKDMTANLRRGRKILLHPILRVILCYKCSSFYGDGNFSQDEDEDKYCRWCGEGGTLFLCSRCSCGFCPRCIRRHFGNEEVKMVEDSDEWSCYICKPKPLWPLRHLAEFSCRQTGSKKQGSGNSDATRSSTPSCKTESDAKEEDSKSVGDLKARLSSVRGVLKFVQSSSEVFRLRTEKLMRLTRNVRDEKSFEKLSRKMSDLDVAFDLMDKVSSKARKMLTKCRTAEVAAVKNESRSSKGGVSGSTINNGLEKENPEMSTKSDMSPDMALSDSVMALDASKDEAKECDEVIIAENATNVPLEPDIEAGSDVNPDSAESKVLKKRKDCAESDIDLIREHEMRNKTASDKETGQNGSRLINDGVCEVDVKGADASVVEGSIASVVESSAANADEKNSIATDTKKTVTFMEPTCNLVSDDPAVASDTELSLINPDGSSHDMVGSEVADKVSDLRENSHGEVFTAASDEQSDNKNDSCVSADLFESCVDNGSSKMKTKGTNDKCKPSTETPQAASTSYDISTDDEVECLDYVDEANEDTGEKNETEGTILKDNVDDSIETETVPGEDAAIKAKPDSDDDCSQALRNAKKAVLESSSSSEDVEKCNDSDDSSDCLKRQRKRLPRKATIKKQPEVKNKLVKTKTSDVERLANLKSLIRASKEEVGSPDKDSNDVAVEKKARNNTKNKGTKRNAEFTDMMNECFAESGPESDLSDKGFKDEISNFYEENLDLVRKVVFATTSDESDVNIKGSTSAEVKKTPLKKKTAKRKISESDSSVNKKNTRRKNVSSGLSDSSDFGVSTVGKRKRSSGSDSSVSKKKKPRRKTVRYGVGGSSDSEEETRKQVLTVSSSSDEEVAKRKTETNKKPWKRINKKNSSDSDSEVEVVSHKSPAKGRKNIKALLKDTKLEVSTKQAVKDESERKNRLAEREKLYQSLFVDEQKELILDFNDKGEVLLSVNKRLFKKLKPHQVQGVKFMWNCCFESVSAIETSHGGGCILAHCMGLGKTLQVVTLVHTILHNELGVKTVLVVCPLSTVSNWVNEFEMWLELAKCDTIDIYDLNKNKGARERSYQMKAWHEGGGVMIISYNMFRLLSNKKQPTVTTTLISPGPDLVVCDEGHLLKNEGSMLSKCLNRVQTARRIVLTGTPLQNNLKEYYTMVQFVKPNILGTMVEFMNRFVNPIENGQFEDSTEYDVRVMKRRSHVLHSLLDGCVQRRDYSVLTPFLPPKYEYVIYIQLSETLANLYKQYIANLTTRAGGASLFRDFQDLQRIWTHPTAMQLQYEQRLVTAARIARAKEEEDSFVDDGSESELSSRKTSSRSGGGSSSDSSIVCVSDGKSKAKSNRRTRNNPDPEQELTVEPPPKPEEKPWWSDMLTEEQFEDVSISGKMLLFFSVLEECEAIGDKLLVFSQSLFTLDVIEKFLDIKNREGYNWELGLDYFRLDGSHAAEKRTAWCKSFNHSLNKRAKLFLISTRAGGLGINLFGANRVIIFDASWNPSHDVQSIFRIYRFGQEKPCYVYRFVAEATMEEKIYNRQVTKLSLAQRVVDEHQIERHYSAGNLQELYKFEPLPREEWKIPIVPKDEVFARLLKKHSEIIVKYHEHDSLLENKEGEELNEEERKAAWAEYETNLVKKANPLPTPSSASGYEAYANMLRQQWAAMAQAKVNSSINPATTQQNLLGNMNVATPAQLPSNVVVNPFLNPFDYYKKHGILPQGGAAPFKPQRPIIPDENSIKAMDLKQLLSFGYSHHIYRENGENMEAYRDRILNALKRT